MFGKNKNKKVGICVMVVTSCFILATVWAVLATPETALADHKSSHNPGGGDDGGGGKETRTYLVKFGAYDLEVEDSPVFVGAASGCRTMSIINPEDSVAHLLFDSPLDLSGVIGDVADFDTCFPDGAKANRMHGLFRDKHDPDKITGILFFKGLDKTGKEIGYRIDYTGWIVGGKDKWTPAKVGDTATISLDTWELKADTGGRKNALSGEGVFTGTAITTILVERISGSECP